MFMITTSIIQVQFILPQELLLLLYSQEFYTEYAAVSFTISDAFHTELLLSCMQNLKRGKAVDIPNYNFKTYKCVPNARKVILLSLVPFIINLPGKTDCSLLLGFMRH